MSHLAATDRWLNTNLGLRSRAVLSIILALAIAGAAVGFLFPRFEASALLQTPQPWSGAGLPDDPIVDLATYRRVAASYSSTSQLAGYAEARKLTGLPATLRLVDKSEEPGFWEQTARAVLPMSKQDQREFGELKDANTSVLIGVELDAHARSAALAIDMVRLLGDYFADAFVRERVRDWVLQGKVKSVGTTDLLKAEVLRSELDIALLEQRATEMKAVVARYPDASRMDARQVVSVSASDGGERFLSPLAQMVSFESAISQRRELIARTLREVRQREVLASFYVPADSLVSSTTALDQLLPALKAMAKDRFEGVDLSEEWAREAKLRIDGSLDRFAAVRSQFTIRNDLRVAPNLIRTPTRMAVLFAFGGLISLAALGFVRASLRLARASSDDAVA